LARSDSPLKRLLKALDPPELREFMRKLDKLYPPEVRAFLKRLDPSELREFARGLERPAEKPAKPPQPIKKKWQARKKGIRQPRILRAMRAAIEEALARGEKKPTKETVVALAQGSLNCTRPDAFDAYQQLPENLRYLRGRPRKSGKAKQKSDKAGGKTGKAARKKRQSSRAKPAKLLKKIGKHNQTKRQ
jgi:hypothetical protein